MEENGIETVASLFEEVKNEFGKGVAFLSRSDWTETAKWYERETIDGKTDSYFNN